MATTPATIHTPPRTIRRRAAPPQKTRAELAREFDELPAAAFAAQPQVAAFLGWSEAKLERDRWAGGGIPYLKEKRNVRYRKADVLEHLSGKIRTSTTA